MKVWKALLTMTGNWQDAAMPKGAEILHVHAQGDAVGIWFKCDPRQDEQTRRFYVAGTGDQLPEEVQGCPYIGTAHFFDGKEVYHVFEKVA